MIYGQLTGSKYAFFPVLLIFIIVAGTSLFSRHYIFRNYSKEDGLPGNRVHKVFQDSRGFIWFITEKGLCRFDGIDFYSGKKALGSMLEAWSIFEDPAGFFLVGTAKNGLKCFPLEGTRKEDQEKILNKYDFPALKNKGITCITRDTGGHLWIAADDCAFRFDGKSLTKYPVKNHHQPRTVYRITQDGNNKIWLTASDGVYRLTGHRFTRFPLPEPFAGSGNFSLLFDSRGRMWIGTHHGVLCYENGSHKVFTKKNGLCHDKINVLYEDNAGRIWICTWAGMNVIDGKNMFSITSRNGLPHDYVGSIIQDGEGNIWFATLNGVSCLGSLNGVGYSARDGLSHNMVYVLAVDGDGRCWAGTPGGLSRIENCEAISISSPGENSIPSVQAMTIDGNGVVWLGTINGVYSLENNRLRHYPEISHNVFQMVARENGSIWFSSNKGPGRIFDGKLSPLPFDYPPGGAVCIFEDSRNWMWFSMHSRVLYYDGKRLRHLDSADGQLAGEFVRWISEDRLGRIWIGCGGGLTRFHPGSSGSDNPSRLKHYTTAEGLPDSTCNFVMEDRRGHLWIGTENGLAEFDGKRFKTYTKRNSGILSNTWSYAVKDSSGRLWLGSDQGVFSFTPPLFPANTVRPPVYITGVKVLEGLVPTAWPRRLSHDENTIRFHYAGLCFSGPKSVRYKYKLHGLNETWKYTDERSIYYPYLPSGDYRFMVKAVNNDGLESAEPASAAFRILPPFWRTWWFLALASLAAVSLPGWFLVSRQRRARERSELRARNRQLVMAQRMELMGNLAAGTVHDLKNLLSIILGYTRVVGRKFAPDDPEREHVETIRNTASTAVQMSKQILSLARYPDRLPGTVELGELLEEILDTLEITLPKNVKTHRRIPVDPVRFAIDPARFQQVVINLCQNAAHAMPGGGDLAVTLSMQNTGPHGEIRLDIRDTGTGIEPEKLDKIFQPLFTTKANGKGTGLGLFVVDQIVREYGGRIDVDSQPGKGTVFTVLFPIPGM